MYHSRNKSKAFGRHIGNGRMKVETLTDDNSSEVLVGTPDIKTEPGSNDVYISEEQMEDEMFNSRNQVDDLDNYIVKRRRVKVESSEDESSRASPIIEAQPLCTTNVVFIKNEDGVVTQTEEQVIVFSCIETQGRSRETKLPKHVVYNSDDEKPYNCRFCSYKCAERSSIIKHIRIHTGEKPFVCSQCTYRCTEKGSLVKHERIHTGEKPYACALCDYRCSERGSLIKHIRIHTGEKPFACNMCDYRCTEKGSLTKHMRIHTGEKPFSCPYCEYRCTEKGSLKKHMRIHGGEKPFACPVCSYKCSDKCALAKHVKSHSTHQTYFCSLCNFQCLHEKILMKHLENHSDPS